MATWDRIKNIGLRRFSTESKDLLKRADRLGWVGRVSSNGHAILRAPDGIATISVVPHYKNNRGRQNAIAALDRWERDR